MGGDDSRICVGRLYLKQDLENEAVPCKDDCNGKNGHCPGFCGQDGYCCKEGEKGNGCDGRIGGDGERVCVGGMYLNLDMENQGSDCKTGCGGKMGHCPDFCGQDGYCCQKKKKGNGCDGQMGVWGKMTCVGMKYRIPKA